MYLASPVIARLASLPHNYQDPPTLRDLRWKVTAAMPQPAVLVVDDDRNLRRILQAKLQRGSFQVSTVADLASARFELEHSHFQVVVLDERLPDGSSLDMLPSLRDLSPESSFVVITAYEENAMRQRAERAGASDILFKPFDLDLLEAVVRTYATEES
jgi:DNA-binding NtrC family response regulator